MLKSLFDHNKLWKILKKMGIPDHLVWSTLKKDVPHLKTKNKPQWDSRTCTIMIKSNSIPARWVFHTLENNNTKEVFPLLWRFWAPRQVSQPGDLMKGLGNTKESDLEGQWDLIIGLPLYCGKQGLQSCRAQTKSYTPQYQRKRAVTPQETEPQLPASIGGSPVEVWVGSGSTQDRGTGSSSPRRSPLV